MQKEGLGLHYYPRGRILGKALNKVTTCEEGAQKGGRRNVRKKIRKRGRLSVRIWGQWNLKSQLGRKKGRKRELPWVLDLKAVAGRRRGSGTNGLKMCFSGLISWQKARTVKAELKKVERDRKKGKFHIEGRERKAEIER